MIFRTLPLAPLPPSSVSPPPVPLLLLVFCLSSTVSHPAGGSVENLNHKADRSLILLKMKHWASPPTFPHIERSLWIFYSRIILIPLLRHPIVSLYVFPAKEKKKKLSLSWLVPPENTDRLASPHSTIATGRHPPPFFSCANQIFGTFISRSPPL